MRVLVTGASGFLGRAAVRRIPGAIALGRTEVPGVPFRACDLEDPASVRAALASGDFDAVVHLAGPAPKGFPGWDDGWPVVRAHHRLAANLAAGLPDGWSGRVVHASGMIVYGIPEQAPIPEEHPLRPQHLYGLAKLVAEDAWRAAAPADLWIVRLPGLFSEDRRSGAAWAFAAAAAKGASPTVLADHPTPWDLLHVDDAAEGLARILVAPGPGPGAINLGYGEVTSLDTVARWFAARAGVQVVLAGRAQPLSGLAIDRAKERFAWPPVALADRLEALFRAAR
jgi:UDP-glucose 4-epimerase